MVLKKVIENHGSIAAEHAKEQAKAEEERAQALQEAEAEKARLAVEEERCVITGRKAV